MNYLYYYWDGKTLKIKKEKLTIGTMKHSTNQTEFWDGKKWIKIPIK